MTNRIQSDSRLVLFPNFPLFVPFNVQMREKYSGFISNHPPHGDFTFNNLLNWLNLDDRLEVSTLNNNLILRFSDSFSDFQQIYTVLGNKNADSTLNIVFNWQKMNNLPVQVNMVPGYFKESIQNELAFHIEHDLDNSDYVYDIKKLIDMDGPELRGFRRQINYYLRTYAPDTKIYSLDLSIQKSRIKLINSLHTWDKVYDYGNDEQRIEGRSINKAFYNQDFAPYQCIVVESEDGVDGFGMFQFPPQKEFAILNYLKCNYEKRSIFDFIFYCTLSYLKTQDVLLVNFEQDLGKPGLRYHKQRLSPSMRLNKYTIKPK